MVVSALAVRGRIEGETTYAAAGFTAPAFGATLLRTLNSACAADRPFPADELTEDDELLGLPASEGESPVSVAATPAPVQAATPTPTPAAPTHSHRSSYAVEARADAVEPVVTMVYPRSFMMPISIALSEVGALTPVSSLAFINWM